ncbi:hypothetical protein M3Y97_00673300 [Aphelenchoides bicaudatus]|nr:hypothetical protein M3Y97_00673300 [Aphelenchoides bicaudatus]
MTRLYKKQRKESQNGVPLAGQILQIHWLSVGPVTLFSAIGVVILFIVAGMTKSIYDMHQLRAPHMQCQVEMRLDLIGQMQALGSSLIILWLVRAFFAPLCLVVADFKNLIVYPFGGKFLPKSKHVEPIKIHCCSIDRVSWSRTV